MDNFEEKKWFVYLGDHHEGPFSPTEIQEKMAAGAISATHFVWAEGMDDWKPMPEVAPFSAMVVPNTPPPILPSLDSSPQIDSPPPPTLKKSRPTTRWRVFLALSLILVAGLAMSYSQGDSLRQLLEPIQPALLSLTEKVPSLAQWISPIPALNDVDATEYEELRSAAAANLEKDGPKLAFALSQRDTATPIVYVASNLPDGATIQIHFEGVSDTLIGQLSASANTEVVLQKKLGQSQAIQLADLQPLPRGQYHVYALETEKQPPDVAEWLLKLQPVGTQLPAWAPPHFKLFTTRSYFLGGPKDSNYAARLQEFHDKLQKKATEELSEIRQFTSTLESELATTQLKFKSIYKPSKPNLNKKKEWDAFHEEWLKFQTQMSTTFAKWEPEIVKKAFFYSDLYQMVQQTQQSLEKAHKIQNSYFMGEVTDLNAFDIQLGEALSVAESSIASLKAKVEQAAKIPATPNGMPRKDGL